MLPNGIDPKNIKVIAINGGGDSNPINFMDGLALLLIGLKLTEHLEHWTWIEVLAPLWGPFMIGWLIRLLIATFFTKTTEEEE